MVWGILVWAILPVSAVIPDDWARRHAAGDLLYSTSTVQDYMAPCVGNGYVATNVPSTTEHINGVYNGKLGGDYNTDSYRARVPATTNIRVGRQNDVAWALDMGRGVMYAATTVSQTTVLQTWYAHRVERYALVMEVTVDNTNGTTNLVVELQDNPGPASRDIDFQKKVQDGLEVWVGTTRLTETPSTPPFKVGVVRPTVPPTLTIPAGQSKRWTYITTRRSSLDSQSVESDSLADYHRLASLPKGHLLQTHHVAWSKLRESGMEVTGDLNLALALNQSTYSILSSLRSDWPHSTSPGGLPTTTNPYDGHVFWDDATWMYPTMAVFHPSIAASMVQYRHDRLPAAFQTARGYGRGGARYPWESAVTGLEASVPPYSDLEIHVNGDIAFATQQYWRATHDLKWLKQVGYPLLSGIAAYWVTRVEWDAAAGVYNIKNVMPPDENHEGVDNSVFTNVGAIYTLRFAMDAAKRLGVSTPANWSHVADNIKVPFDAANQRHPEFDGYKGDTIKQADVILLNFPFMYPNMTDTVRRNDLDYYGPRTEKDGPAMTWSMYAVGYQSIGETDKAAAMFTRGYQHNMIGPFLNWQEGSGGGGCANFITGAGGFLQSVWAAYGGLRLMDETLLLHKPTPAPNTTRLLMRRVSFYGESIDVDVRSDHTTVALSSVSPGTHILEAGVAGSTTFHTLTTTPMSFTAGQQVTVKPKE